MQEEMRKRDLRQHGQTYLLTTTLYFQKMALWRCLHGRALRWRVGFVFMVPRRGGGVLGKATWWYQLAANTVSRIATGPKMTQGRAYGMLNMMLM